MADEKVIDPETISLDELRDLADKEMAGEPAAVAAAPAAEDTEVEETVFRREIDLGDGSGVQVFEGRDMDELVDKLATAQEHATRKIRELTQAAKPAVDVALVKKPALSADEEWLLGQELMTKPSEAFGKLFERIVGSSIDDFKTKQDRLAAFATAQSEHQASEQFVQKHPEYPASPANGERIVRYLQTYRLPGTVENLEKAFQELNESGLMAPKPAVDAQAPTLPAAPKRAATGLSSRHSAAAVPKTELTEGDLYKMPMAQLEELANAQARGEQ